MAKYASMVKETTTTTGTGTIDLDGAVSGFRAFLDPANISDQDYVPYFLSDASGAWEEGFGKVIAGTPNQLERGFIQDSSAGGSAITLTAGTHTVALGPIAATRTPHYCRLILTSNQSVAQATNHTVSWDAAEVDTDNMWSAGNPTKAIVPDWVSTLRVMAGARWTSNNSGQRILTLSGNNITGAKFREQFVPKWDSSRTTSSDILEATPGAELWFVVHADVSGMSLIAAAKEMHFTVELLS